MNPYYSKKAVEGRAERAKAKMQERDMRRDRGEVRVEGWLSAQSASYLDRLKEQTGRTTSEILDYAIDAMGAANLKSERTNDHHNRPRQDLSHP